MVSLAVKVTLGVIFGVLIVGSIGVGVYFIVKATSSSNDLFWPYGAAPGDTAYTGTSTTVYTPDQAVTGGYHLFGQTNYNGPNSVTLDCGQGKITVSPDPAQSGVSQGAVIHGSKPPVAGYDAPDSSAGRFCYHRKTTSAADKDRLCALIGVFSATAPYEAYVFTWVDYTLSGKLVGTWQVIVVFSNSQTFLIRVYDDNLSSIDGITDQFLVMETNNAGDYETSTTASEVRGQREVFDLTEAATAPNLIDATTSSLTSCGLISTTPITIAPQPTTTTTASTTTTTIIMATQATTAIPPGK